MDLQLLAYLLTVFVTFTAKFALARQPLLMYTVLELASTCLGAALVAHPIVAIALHQTLRWRVKRLMPCLRRRKAVAGRSCGTDRRVTFNAESDLYFRDLSRVFNTAK